MIGGKYMTRAAAALTALAVCLCLGAMAFADELTGAAGGGGVTMEYETALFDTSEPIQIDIIMDEADWEDMLASATAETYYQCDVEVNGQMFYRVGIRPKGNTSLTSIASDPTTDRYSFKLEFDQYVDGQTCYGLDKLVLNNNYADATNMKEALIYDMFQYLGAEASLYNYAAISVNGEYWGVYLALEAVEDSFLLRNYGVSGGALYKPDSMDFGDMGGGMDFAGADFSGMTPPDGAEPFPQFDGEPPEDFDPAQFAGGTLSADQTEAGTDAADAGDGTAPDRAESAAPAGRGGMGGGFSLGGGGADLRYTGDDLDNYTTIWDSAVTDTSDADHRRVVTALKNIAEGTDLEEYMDVDDLLKYMAVHVFSVNEDSLSGTMAHNYYLYEEDGRLNLLPWDYNLALGGMGGGSDATSVVNEAIDEAFSGTDFFDTLMENETYHERYYAYLRQLVDEYLLGDGFESFYARTRGQLDALVESDPTAFYTYEEYTTAAETLYEVVKFRGQSIQGQLDGTIPSTADEQAGSDALIDASHIDLSVMGSMNAGGGMERGGSRSGREEDHGGAVSDETAGEVLEAGGAVTSFSPAPLTDETDGDAGGEEGEAPDPGQTGGTPPADFVASPFGGGADEAQTDSGAAGGRRQSGFDMAGFPGTSGGGDSAASGEALVTYGICFALMIAALVFAPRFRRRPRRR